MKNQIKYIFVILFAFISIDGNGQSFLVKGGLNLSRISEINYNVYGNGSDLNIGFHLGISYEKKISDVFFLELGSMLNSKGVTYMNWSPEGFYPAKTNLVYLDVPILIKGYFELTDDILIYNTLGHYLGIGLWGNYKDEKEGDGTIMWGYNGGGLDYRRYTRLDFGLYLGAGVDFKGVQVGFAYDFSLFNNIPNPDLGNNRYLESSKHNVFRLSLSYRFVKQGKENGLQ